MNLMQSDEDQFLDGNVCITQIITTVAMCRQFQQLGFLQKIKKNPNLYAWREYEFFKNVLGFLNCSVRDSRILTL